MTHLANKLSALLMASALFAACKSDDPVITADDTAIHIATRVAGQAAADGTSGNKTDYTPADGTCLYLYYKTMGNTGQGQHAQYAYTTQSGEWTTTGAAPLYWDDLTKQTGTDAYPFFAASPQAPAAAPAVNANQSTAEAYKTSDQLIAYTATDSRRTDLYLDLHHILSQLKVTITSTGNDNEKLDLSKATLTINAAKLKYTLTYTGTVKAENNATLTVPCTEAPAIATATGTATATPLTPKTGSRTAGTANYTAVVPPQTVALEFVFTINGNEYSETVSATELKSGYATSFEFTVHKSGVELNSIKLTDWKDAATVQADVTVKLEGEASDAGGGTAAISGKTMNIWKQAGNAETDKGNAHQYNKGADNKWSSSNPIYVDDTNIGTDHFYATIDNGTGAITGVHDLIGAGPATMGKGTLNFGFTHLMAQLAVNLTKGTGFPDDVDLSKATVSTPTLNTTYTLSYNPSGNALMATATDSYPICYERLATGVTTTTSGAETTTDETAYLVVPQTISTTEEFIVSVRGKTYTGKLSQAMTLQAGKKNVLTLTLNPTGMTVGNITLKDWDTTSSSGSGSVDGVIIPSTSLDKVDQSGTLHLVATTDGTNPAPNGHGTYPVTYDAGKKEASVNTKDATYTPILWDHLAKGSYTYRALFVPTAHRHNTGAANNHEQDFLTGTSAATPWGTTPDFSQTGHTLTHALAQLTVTLTSDGTITADELNTATITTVSKKSLSISPENGTLSINGAAQDKTVTLLSAGTDKLTKDAIIAPQELQNIVITLTIGGDAKTYTVKPDVGTTLEAGKNHTLTATLKRSEMGIIVTQTDWEEKKLGEKDITVDE